MTNPSRSKAWRPTATLDRVRARARLLGLIREFFSSRDVLEVTTPTIGRAANPDPNLTAISVSSPDGLRGWLRTSPEHAHKRLLSAESGAIYELGPCFRGGERGRLHNPEFTMLEWYRPGFTRSRLIAETVDLIDCASTRWGHEYERADWTYAAAFVATLDIDPMGVDDATLRSLAEQEGGPGGLDREGLLDFLFSTQIATRWPQNQLTVVTDFPADRPAMARVQGEIAERFEVFIGSCELANGYRELTDADELRRRWQADEAQDIDERLLAAMRCGLPECAGVALGVDRLLMALERCEHIDDVLSFPYEIA